MPNGLFLVNDRNELVEMNPQQFETEDIFQTFIAQYPKLLSAIGTDGIHTAGPSLLLVTREAAIPDEADANGRWSLDHLFLDSEGVPTLVEVKRSTDTRLRREVVGQMLDYAANAAVYWPVEKIKAMFEANCDRQLRDAEQDLCSFLGDGIEPEQFWMKVKTNLQAQRIRLVFVADEIPTELRRIVEFLNKQMDPAEVLAVEIRRFSDGTQNIFQSQLIGRTEEAQNRKITSASGSRKWDEMTFFAELIRRCGESEAAVARQILAWILPESGRTSQIDWGHGAKNGSFIPVLACGHTTYSYFTVYTYGTVEMNFQYCLTKAPFLDERNRLKLLDRFNRIPGVHFEREVLSRRPGIPLDVLKSRDALIKFQEAIDWMIAEIKSENRESERTMSNEERQKGSDQFAERQGFMEGMTLRDKKGKVIYVHKTETGPTEAEPEKKLDEGENPTANESSGTEK